MALFPFDFIGSEVGCLFIYTAERLFSHQMCIPYLISFLKFFKLGLRVFWCRERFALNASSTGKPNDVTYGTIRVLAQRCSDLHIADRSS
jgi:hypothetical protein